MRKAAVVMVATMITMGVMVGSEEKAEEPRAPVKGDTIYVPHTLDFYVLLGQPYDDIPYDRLDCPSTGRCYYRYRACEPLYVLKSRGGKLKVAPFGTRGVTARLDKGWDVDLVAAVRPTADECRLAKAERLAAEANAEMKRPPAP